MTLGEIGAYIGKYAGIVMAIQANTRDLPTTLGALEMITGALLYVGSSIALSRIKERRINELQGELEEAIGSTYQEVTKAKEKRE